MKMRLNPDLDIPLLQSRFTDARRLQITDFLNEDDAKRLEAALSKAEWHLVMNDRERHIDLPVSELPKLGLDRIRKAILQAQGRAATEFQYVYENSPIADMYQSGRLNVPEFRDVFDLMNSEAVRTLLTQITGLRVDFCDMQATRYGPGHVLTSHDDGIEGRNRQFAYVLGLTRNWQAIWGGQLQFTTEEGAVEQSFVPVFNTLSIFAVPTPHHVTQVASYAPHARVSLTGWFRQNAA